MTRPLPSFFWEVRSIRIDGDRSADPRDYQDVPEGEILGEQLVAFVDGKLAGRLRPLPAKERGTYPATWAVVLAMNPTRADLRAWYTVTRITIHNGQITVLSTEFSEMLERAQRDLQAKIRERVRKWKAYQKRKRARNSAGPPTDRTS